MRDHCSNLELQLVPRRINVRSRRNHLPEPRSLCPVALVGFIKEGSGVGEGFPELQQAHAFHLHVMSPKSQIPCYGHDSPLPRNMEVTLELTPAPPSTLASTSFRTLEEALVLCKLKSSGLDPKCQGKACFSGGARTKTDLLTWSPPAEPAEPSPLSHKSKMNNEEIVMLGDDQCRGEGVVVAGKGHRVLGCVNVEVKFKIGSPQRAALRR